MTEPYVEFERGRGKDHEHVCARVYMPLGITIELWSEEPIAERRWEVEEVELHPGDGPQRGPVTLTPRRGPGGRLSDCELVAFVRREWDREVAREVARVAAAARGQESLDVAV